MSDGWKAVSAAALAFGLVTAAVSTAMADCAGHSKSVTASSGSQSTATTASIGGKTGKGG